MSAPKVIARDSLPDWAAGRAQFECLQRDMQREATQSAEWDRIKAVLDSGYVPPQVGPKIPEAPARGPVRMFDTFALYPDGNGFKSKPAGYMNRKTLRCADSFDRMAGKAAGRGKALPLSEAHVAMGRYYRDLVEWHAEAGLRCSSLDGRSGGGGSNDFMERLLEARQRIDVLRKRIGTGSAMVVRRVRPSARGSRVTIMDRRLVDIICLEDGTMNDVLRAHGWVTKGDVRTKLYQALAQVLLRMMGPVRSPTVSAKQFGEGCLPLWE